MLRGNLRNVRKSLKHPPGHVLELRGTCLTILSLLFELNLTLSKFNSRLLQLK